MTLTWEICYEVMPQALDLGLCSVEDLFFTKKKSAAGTTRGGTHKL
jgi:hypothetical protein